MSHSPASSESTASTLLHPLRSSSASSQSDATDATEAEKVVGKTGSSLLSPSSLTSTKPCIVGIYGLPGSGKKTLVSQLKRGPVGRSFDCYDGVPPMSNMLMHWLDKTVMAESSRQYGQLVKNVKAACDKTARPAVIAGHFSFWRAEDADSILAHGPEVFNSYSHVIYLDVDPAVIADRRQTEISADCREESVRHLGKWQDQELAQMRSLCYERNVLFARMPFTAAMLTRVSTFVTMFQQMTPELNTKRATDALDDHFNLAQSGLDKFVVIQGDQALAAEDSGDLFIDEVSWTNSRATVPVRDQSSCVRDQSFHELQQAQLDYEELAQDKEYKEWCKKAADKIHIHPDFRDFLHHITGKSGFSQEWVDTSEPQTTSELAVGGESIAGQIGKVGIVLITHGLRLVWQLFLEKYGLSGVVKVIGGGRVSDGCVITKELKKSIVEHLQRNHKAFVWAFGTCASDDQMLKRADKAIVVPAKTSVGSASIDRLLVQAVVDDGVEARRALLSKHDANAAGDATESGDFDAVDNANLTPLPTIDITSEQFKHEILSSVPGHYGLHVFDATDKISSQLYMSPVLDLSLSAPALCEAQWRIGQYLAIDCLSQYLGVEKVSISHAHDDKITRHRFHQEDKTLVVAMMTSGLHFAQGVWKALTAAQFDYATVPEDLTAKDLKGMATIILVDAVIGLDSDIVEFIRRIRKLNTKINIVVMACVVQRQCVQNGGLLKNAATRDAIGVVALKLASRAESVGLTGAELEARMFGREVSSLK